MKSSVTAFTALALILALPAGHAASTGSMSMPSATQAREQTPEQKAKAAQNQGVKLLKRAEKAKDASRAEEGFRKAAAKFEEATALDASLHQAWNHLGYSRRKLGDFAGALEAYDRALALKPDFAEAIEYRGQAYLGMNRLEEAKQAYLALFARDRKLSSELLTAMKDWLAAKRAQGADVQSLAEFEQWVNERASIAGQTAALTPEGAGAGWR